MAIRDDVSVDWFASPRIITVAAPSTYIKIEDLIHTLRELEYIGVNQMFESVLFTGGNDLLGDIRTVMIATLRNALVAFEARGAPPWVSCTIDGGNLLAVDENGDPMWPIKETAYVHVSFAQATTGAILAGSGVTEQDKSDIADKVLDGEILKEIKDYAELGAVT